MTNKSTETPRTDAEIWDVVYHHKNEIVVDADFARELERELNELWSRLDKQIEAEAEVERLRGQLQQAIDIAEGLEKYGIHELTDDLRELKSKIK